MINFDDIARGAAQRNNNPPAPQYSRLTAAEQAEVLLDHYKTWARRHEFKPGMLVRQKDGFRTLAATPADKPVVVLDVLDNPNVMTDTRFFGTNIMGMVLDIVVGGIEPDGALYVSLVDSRRFELWGG